MMIAENALCTFLTFPGGVYIRLWKWMTIYVGENEKRFSAEYRGQRTKFIGIFMATVRQFLSVLAGCNVWYLKKDIYSHIECVTIVSTCTFMNIYLMCCYWC